MPLIDPPKELTKSHWDKKKGAVPADSPLESQLKTFEKKFDAVDWGAFEPGWEKKAKTADELKDAYAAVDRAYRTKVIALKMEGTAVADAAQKLLKDKGLAKVTLDACKDIGDAAKAFGKAVDAGLAELETIHDKAASSLKDEGGEDEEPGSALIDPKRLVAQLQMCKRMPERRVSFAFVGDGKSEPVFSLAPKMTGNRLFAKIKDETGVKAGSYGRAWITDKVLYLEMDKPLSGLVKKVRGVLKTVGFKVTKIVLAGEDGKVLESDEAPEDADDREDAQSEGGGGTEDAKAAFAALLKTLSPQVAKAVADGGPSAQDIKLKASEAAMFGRKQDWVEGLGALRQVQQMLAGAGGSIPEAPPAPPVSKPSGDGPRVAEAKGSAVVFAQLRLVWENSKKTVQQKLDALNQAILDEWDDGEAVTAAGNLKKVLARFNEGLGDSLDDLYNAATPDDKQRHAAKSKAIAERYLAYLADDPLVAHVEANPYEIAVDTKNTLATPLTVLQRQLAQIVN